MFATPPKWIKITITLAYGLFLTKLLLSSTPWVDVGGPQITAVVPAVPTPDTHSEVQSLFMHILAYGGWAILGAWCLVAAPLSSLWPTALGMIVHGGLAEVGQHYLAANRWMSIGDFLGNVLGIFIGFAVFHLYTKLTVSSAVRTAA